MVGTTDTYDGHRPSTLNNWGGDKSKIVSEAKGIKPKSGLGMLQLIATRPIGTGTTFLFHSISVFLYSHLLYSQKFWNSYILLSFVI